MPSTMPSRLQSRSALLVARKRLRAGAGLARFRIGLALIFPIVAGAASSAGDFELTLLALDYGIEVEVARESVSVPTTGGALSARRATRAQARRFAPLFIREWRSYPPGLVERAKLARVVLCSGLALAGQPRTAIPDFERNVLYLDIARAAEDEAYMRRVIHHEFFHLIDYRDDGQVYSDATWSALNPPKFRYGRGGKHAQSDPRTGVVDSRRAGFLNPYSTMGVEEDKAEVFAHLFVAPELVAQKAKRDPVFAAKVAAMKSLLQRFCPELDDAYWKGIARGRRA